MARELAQVRSASPRRPRAAPAYEAFERTMRRVDNLLAVHDAERSPGSAASRQRADVLRAALVLAVDALEALVFEVAVEAIPLAARNGTLVPGVARWIKDDAESALALLSDREPVERATELCRRRLGRPAVRPAPAIDDVLRNLAGQKEPWARAADLLSSETSRWDPASVQAKLDEIVERERAILSPAAGTRRRVERRHVTEAVRVVRAVGRAVGESLAPPPRTARRA